jgi:hypothetical protein
VSAENVKAFLERVLAEEPFFELFIANPEKAIQSYDLSSAETEMLVGLTQGPYTQTRRGLMDTERIVAAAIEYKSASGAPSKPS